MYMNKMSILIIKFNKYNFAFAGFMIASTLTSKSEDVDLTPVNTCENNTKDFNPEDNASAVTEGPGGERSDILFNPEETENVEISKINYPTTYQTDCSFCNSLISLILRVNSARLIWTFFVGQ